MYGVILWSNPDDRKAVIWCEDHGDLVYFEDKRRASRDDDAFFGAGDYVEFQVESVHGVRRSSSAQTVLSASFPMPSDIATAKPAPVQPNVVTCGAFRRSSTDVPHAAELSRAGAADMVALSRRG